MRARVLSQEEIKQAFELKAKGFSNRDIAIELERPKTTIWENIYRTKPRSRINRPPRVIVRTKTYKDLNSVAEVIKVMKQNDFTSGEISDILQIPLEQVNYVYIRVI